MATQEMTARTGNGGFLDPIFPLPSVEAWCARNWSRADHLPGHGLQHHSGAEHAGRRRLWSRGRCFVATCLIAALRLLLMGCGAKLPMAIGCAISPPPLPPSVWCWGRAGASRSPSAPSS